MSDTPSYPRRLLDLLLAREALRFGSFVLKSGRRSPYFINTGRLHHGADVLALGRCYAELIAERFPEVEVVFGPAYKGIPLAIGAAQALEATLGRPIGWAYDRKEVKGHGDGGAFVGAPLQPSTRVVVVDDVLTAGTALRESIAKLQPLEVDLLAAVVSVDRRERSDSGFAIDEIAAEAGFPVLALLRMDEVLAELDAGGGHGLDAEALAAIREHLAT